MTYEEMGETLTGELVPRAVPYDELRPAALRGVAIPAALRENPGGTHLIPARKPRTWTVHYVTWGQGAGTIEGMDRADALRLAEELGGQAYTAAAQLTEHNVVMVGPWEPISV